MVLGLGDGAGGEKGGGGGGSYNQNDMELRHGWKEKKVISFV